MRKNGREGGKQQQKMKKKKKANGKEKKMEVKIEEKIPTSVEAYQKSVELQQKRRESRFVQVRVRALDSGKLLWEKRIEPTMKVHEILLFLQEKLGHALPPLDEEGDDPMLEPGQVLRIGNRYNAERAGKQDYAIANAALSIEEVWELSPAGVRKRLRKVMKKDARKIMRASRLSTFRRNSQSSLDISEPLSPDKIDPNNNEEILSKARTVSDRDIEERENLFEHFDEKAVEKNRRKILLFYEIRNIDDDYDNARSFLHEVTERPTDTILKKLREKAISSQQKTCREKATEGMSFLPPASPISPGTANVSILSDSESNCDSIDHTSLSTFESLVSTSTPMEASRRSAVSLPANILESTAILSPAVPVEPPRPELRCAVKAMTWTHSDWNSALTSGNFSKDHSQRNRETTPAMARRLQRDAREDNAMRQDFLAKDMAAWDGLSVGQVEKRAKGIRLAYCSPPLKGGFTENTCAALNLLTRLERLNLSQNELVGPLPGLQLGRLASLRQLQLQGNRLTGPLPASLTLLGGLSNLNLSRNKFTGAVPRQWSSLGALESLDLSINELTGSLPDGIGELHELRVLDVSSNRIKGYLDKWVGRLPDLNRLSLQHTLLGGSLPEAITRLRKLEYLHLNNCKFDGDLPVELLVCCSPHLREIFLHNCNFWEENALRSDGKNKSDHTEKQNKLQSCNYSAWREASRRRRKIRMLFATAAKNSNEIVADCESDEESKLTTSCKGDDENESARALTVAEKLIDAKIKLKKIFPKCRVLL